VNKKEKIKAILTQLLAKTKKTNRFSRYEIEHAIQTILLAADQRTISNWFELLWNMEFFAQPIVGKYDICWDKLVDLEIGRPAEIDPNQRRLPTN
jgi:hypothetical protein